MTYTINNKTCTHCAGCSSVCPTMAIVVTDDNTLITDACTECGNCYRFCPVSAVVRSVEDNT